jgi:type I restriction enzyme R subunit
MIARMGENDKIVTRYMADNDFQGAAFPILAKEIFETVRERSEQEARQASSGKS